MALIRRACLDDAKRIWQIQTDSIRSVCRTHYQPDVIEAWASQLKPSSYEVPIEEREVIVAEQHGQVVGFGQLNLETHEMETLYVDSEQIGKGIGAELLKSLESIAHQNGVIELKIASSLNAVSFYQKHGYQQICKMPEEVPSPVLVCVGMSKSLDNASSELKFSESQSN